MTAFTNAAQTTRAIRGMATLLAAVIAFALPAIYFSLQYQSHRSSMEVEAVFNAARVSDLINKNPEFWRFETHRLEGFLIDLTDEGMEVRRILDAKGKVIVQSDEEVDTPVISTSAELRDSGSMVGHFEVVRSLRSLLMETAGMGFIGLFLGSCVLMLLRVYPLRSLNLALESLASEKRRAELVLNSIGDGVVVMDSRGILLSCNPAAGKIFGYEPGELVGQNVKILLPATYHAEHEFLLRRLLETGQEHRIGTDREIIAQRHDDGLFTMEISIAKFDLEGQLAFLGSIRDITDRKEAQAELANLQASLEERVKRRTAQLQTANEELQAFSFSVSHDLRTPLTSIAGFSGLLRREVGGDQASDRARHCLDRIGAGVKQMSYLIDALLKLAQISQVKLQWSSVNLSDMVQTVLNCHQAAEPARVVQLDLQAGVVAQCDATLILQVLEHLLGNAWKFSSQQPQTHIAFTGSVNPEGETVYAVQDNGAGFDMAYSSKLFSSFQRLHTADEFDGAGMGLVTVQRIITRHSGRVWAEASPGLGARFCFTLGTATV